MNELPDDAVDSAECTVFLEDRDDAYAMLSYRNRSYSDAPDLVHDRIEVSGVFEHFEVPEPGDKKPLGEVAWGDDGLPRRLECVNGVVVTFEDDVPTVHPNGDGGDA